MPANGDILNGFVWSDVQNAWVVSLLTGQGLPSGGGGGGSGGGDDLDTTPVAPLGSSLALPVPNWLAGAPILECPGDVLVTVEHRGAWLHLMSDIGTTIILPDDWPVGMAFGARQIGVGPVEWAVGSGSGATMQLPFTRADHTGISEQYEEVIFKVVANDGGHSAVWGVSGATV
jgi:hypothetical protein